MKLVYAVKDTVMHNVFGECIIVSEIHPKNGSKKYDLKPVNPDSGCAKGKVRCTAIHFKPKR